MTVIDIPDTVFSSYIIKNAQDLYMFFQTQIKLFLSLAFDTCCEKIYFVSLIDLCSILHVCYVLTYQKEKQ